MVYPKHNAIWTYGSEPKRTCCVWRLFAAADLFQQLTVQDEVATTATFLEDVKRKLYKNTNQHFNSQSGFSHKSERT